MFYAHVVKVLKMMAENEHTITIPSTEYESRLWKIQSVFNLPPHITSLDIDAFKPNVISFGPYHYNKQHLKPMEAHKLRSFNRFLEITKTTPQRLLDSFKQIEQELMDHYDQLDDKWRDGHCFLELMIRDGCFMLDILLRREYLKLGCRDDPVFGHSFHSHVMRKNIKRDMLLIENQLPLLVLKKLIADDKVVLEMLKAKDYYVKLNVENIVVSKQEEGDMTKEEQEFIHRQIHRMIILVFFDSYLMHIQRHDVLCLHALDVLRETMIVRTIDSGELDLKYLPTATELRRTGVSFKKKFGGGNLGETHLMDITFDEENGVLAIPQITIDKETKLIFLNLMAFENFQACKCHEVSAYIYFMASLIPSAKDVSLLRSVDIINVGWRERDRYGFLEDKWPEDNEGIATLFHELAESPLADPDGTLEKVSGKLVEYFIKKGEFPNSEVNRSGSKLKEKQSVFKLPTNITSLNPNAFKPIVISFGPFHYNEQHLKPMEAHKLRSFKCFQYNTGQTRTDLLNSFKPMEQMLRNHYQQLGEEWKDRDRFLELMIREGCFMLDILQRNTIGYADDPVFGQTAQCNNIKRDMLLIENQLPLLVLKKLIANYRNVLEKLRAKNISDWKKVEEGHMTEDEFIHEKIHELILKFLEPKEKMNIQSNKDLCFHALDVFRANMIGRSIPREDKKVASIQSATDLHYTGVTFRRNDTFNIKDITFENWVLTLPPIIIIDKDKTESKYLNLMAFEHFKYSKRKEVSSYINFMGLLVCTDKDVRFLRKKEIIETSRKSDDEDEEIAALFHERLAKKDALFHELAKSQSEEPDDSLDVVRQNRPGEPDDSSDVVRQNRSGEPDDSSDVVRQNRSGEPDDSLDVERQNGSGEPDDSSDVVRQNRSGESDDSSDVVRKSLADVRESLANHYKWHSWWGRCIGMLAKSGSKFKRTYCEDLLTATGLIAGTILLIFTVGQTIYAIISYYEGKRPQI